MCWKSVSLVLACWSCIACAGTSTTTIVYSGGSPLCPSASCAADTYYTDQFLCESSSAWFNGTRYFKDPIPIAKAGRNVITSISFVVAGVFGCPTESHVALHQGEYDNLDLCMSGELIGQIQVLNSSGDACQCKNCAGSYMVTFAVDGWSTYAYGGNNSFQLISPGFSACVSSVGIFLEYETATTGPATLIGPSTTSYTSSTSGFSSTGSGTGTRTSASTGSGNSTALGTTSGMNPETHTLVVMGAFMLGGMLCINLFVVGGWYCFRKKGGYDSLPENENPVSPHQLGKAISFKDVVLAERIGRGSFGEVYRGIWLSTEVAVKKLPLEIVANTALIEEFNREVKLLRSLMHPNILQFMGSCHITPDICLITEYMPRGDLYKIIHDPAVRLDWELIKRFAVDIGKGMNYLHRSNPVIIHRDLKSHNVLIGQHWNAKVADFGLSKIIKDSVEYGKFTPCGTPKWAAPEVLRNEHYSTQADVYSFGIILWEMATRHDPFPNMSAFELIVQVGRNNLRPTLPSNLYPPLERLIVACWNDNPNKRPTFEQLLQTFESL